MENWYRIHAYYTAGFWIGGATAFVLFWAMALIGYFLPEQFAAGIGTIFGIALVIGLFVLILLNIATLVAYVGDAGQLATTSYEPFWPAWAVGHLIAGPLVAPYYLYKRNKQIGNDYSNTYLDALPAIGKRVIFAAPQN